MASAKKKGTRPDEQRGRPTRRSSPARAAHPTVASAAANDAARSERESEPELRELAEDALRELRAAAPAGGDPLEELGTPDGAGAAATSRPGTSPELAGGDVDAAEGDAGTGEEAVGGSTPTPDQDVVDEIGRAAGLTYQDDEPLRGAEEKVARRDEDRWELNPASAEDFAERRSFEHALPEKRGRRG